MAIAYVNGTATFAAGSATSLASSALSVTTGNLIVVFTRLGFNVPLTGVTDTAGNRYLPLGALPLGGGGGRVELWAAWNITGHASNVVTATFSSSSANAINVGHFSGTAPTPWDGASASGSSSTTSVTSSAFSTVAADEVIITGSDIAFTGGTWTPGTGYTIAQQDASTVTMMQYKVVSAKQVGVTASATHSASATKTILVAAFAAATTGPGGGGERAYAFLGVEAERRPTGVADTERSRGR